MAPRPEERYATAVELASEVEHWLADEPVSAYREPWQARLRRWMRRQRTAVTGVAAALLATVLLGGGGWWWLAQAREARRVATANEVNQALAEANRLWGQARTAPVGDLRLWAEALSAAKRARGLLASGAGDEGLEQRVQELLTDLENEERLARQKANQAEQDRQMVATVEEIRLKPTDTPGGDLDRRGAARDYAEAFRKYGIDVEKLEVAEAAAQIRQRAIRDQLVAALDGWANIMRDDKIRQRLLGIAIKVDADAGRNRLREALARKDLKTLLQQVRSSAIADLPPTTLALLGEALANDGDVLAAVTLLRQGQRQHPGDIWINSQLGFYYYLLGRDLTGPLGDQVKLGGVLASSSVGPLPTVMALHLRAEALLPTKDEPLRFLTAALALRPRSAGVHNSLGNALAAKGQLGEAIQSFRQAITLDPKYALAHVNLGGALATEGQLDKAIQACRQALALDPKLADAHHNLGAALYAQGDVQGAIECYRKALQLAPKFAQAHYNLGAALAAKGQLDEAIQSFRQALALDPKYALAHVNLGSALARKGQLDKAIQACRQALALDPKLALAHYNLGAALYAQGDVQGAIECYRKALQLAPKFAQAHYNLGNALAAKKDWKGAIACYKQALALNSKYAEAHCNLGHALRWQGHFAEALEALQRGHQLGSQRADWHYPSARWVQHCQRLLELDSRLPALLQGDDQPKDTTEQLALADLCQHYKKRYAAAARFYAAAFADQPKLSPAQELFCRYNAACAAVLAAAGQGGDAAKLDAKEKSRLRQQALTWLRHNLKHHVQQLEAADAKTRQLVRQTLQHWQKDPDLDSVRGKEALAQLPKAEHTAWQEFWAEVEHLLRQT
jgi:tetratricopeptide (TPR) repeat protein